jgi:hypothetical protein
VRVLKEIIELPDQLCRIGAGTGRKTLIRALSEKYFLAYSAGLALTPGTHSESARSHHPEEGCG